MHKFSFIVSLIWKIYDNHNLPSVKVPVLSKTIVSIDELFYKISPPFIKIPWFAAIPVATITAVGVASPSAHGQAMTRVAIPNLNAKVNFEIHWSLIIRFGSSEE